MIIGQVANTINGNINSGYLSICVTAVLLYIFIQNMFRHIMMETINIEKDIGETETSFTHKIDTSELNTGKYKIYVNAEDYAGNSAEQVEFDFSVDHELPDGDIEVVSHTVKYIDSQNWINEKENENTVPVKIKFTPKNKYDGSQWDKFIFQINESEQKIIKSPNDLENGYLELELPTDDVYKNENKYVIKAQLFVSSTNFSEIEYDNVVKVRGMDIVFVTTAKSNEEAFDLLDELGIPFRK